MDKLLSLLKRHKITLISLIVLFSAVWGIWHVLIPEKDEVITWKYYEMTDEELFSRDYRYIINDTANWRAFEYPRLPELRKNTTAVMLSFTLPKIPRYYVDYMLLNVTNQDIKIYIEDKLIYQSGSLIDLEDSIGRRRHTVDYREPLLGKKVTILLHSRLKSYLGHIDNIVVDDYSVIRRKTIIDDSLYIFSIPVALSMISFLLLELYWNKVQDKKLYLYTIGFLTSYCFWTAGMSMFFPMVFDDSPTWWLISMATIYIMPIFASLSLMELVDPVYRPGLDNCYKVFLLMFIVSSVAQLLGIDGYINMLYIFYPIGIIIGIYMIVVTVITNWDKYPACRYAAYAIFCYMVFGAIDALNTEYRFFPMSMPLLIFSCYSQVPLVLYLIHRQVQHHLMIEQENQQLEKVLEKTRIEAETDHLTGCYNRTQLKRLFNEFKNLAAERNFPLSLAIFDIDHFKTVNDTKGHLEGDRLLKLIARVIQNELDRRHIFVRYGGDEFIIFALHYDLEQMRDFIDDLRLTVVDELDGETLSFGVSTWKGEDDTLPHMIERADKALYFGKQNGRNRVAVETDCDGEVCLPNTLNTNPLTPIDGDKKPIGTEIK